MAAVFKKNKAKIEAYFAKQDLNAIIPELQLENLISNAEEDEIHSTELSKRPHTLTKILESKIVNNPDLFENLKQFLRSFEDFSEILQPDTSTMIVTSSSGETIQQTQIEAPQTIIPGQTMLTQTVQPWTGYPVSSSHPVAFPNIPYTAKAEFYATKPHPILHYCSWPPIASDESPYHRFTATSSSGYSSLHTVDASQQRTMQQKTLVESTSEGVAYPIDTRRHKKKQSGATTVESTSEGVAYSIDTRRHRKKRSGATSFGATEMYTPVSKTKPPVPLISPTSKQTSQPYQPYHSGTFPGIDFSSYRSHTTVGHKGSTIRGEGVELRIPPNAIKRGTSLSISLQGCISGPFSLPEGTQLTSPVFLITCIPQYQFQTEVTLTIHHFVLLQNHEQCKNMVLLTSPQMKVEDKDDIYWKFTFCDKRLQCFPHTSYGEVELTHFSFLCFGIRLSRAHPQLRYRVSVHIPRFISPSYSTIYSITISHSIYTENLKKYIDSTYPDLLFSCTSEVISSEDHSESVQLKLPLKEAEQLGYTIVSDKEPCSIRKKIVNFPTMSRKDKRYARRDKEFYPPRIVLTISENEKVPFSLGPSDSQLHVKVTGIADQSSVCQGFYLPIDFHRIKRETDPLMVPSIQAAVNSADPPGGPGQPTMPELLNFQLSNGSHISIPREVGTHYRSFGTHLLQDPTGSHISALAEREGRNAENINIVVLQEWLSGEGMRDKTWETLASVLDKSGKGELAKKIKQTKLSDSEASYHK